MVKQKDVVLILNGETIQAIAVARCLHKSGYKVVSFCDTKESYGYRTRYADEKVLCPSIHKDEKGFLPFLVDYLDKHRVDVIMPMNDFSAEFLANHQTVIDKTKHRFVMSPVDIFYKGYDKKNLMKACEEQGIPHPKTFDLDKVTLEEASNRISFPALIKPNITSGGRGITPVDNKTELFAKYPLIKDEYGSCHLQEFIPEGGRQLKVQVLLSDKGEELLTTVMHKIRFYPIKGGSSCCNMTIKDERLSKMCVQLLQKIGWIGFADFDLIEDPRDGVIMIMEINPRVPACIKSSLVSGVDFATAIADSALGKDLKKYTYKPGKYLRYFGMDLLWFLKSPNRWNTKPCWFNFISPKVYFQDSNDITDMGPFIFGTLGAFKKQVNPEFRKKKSALN